MVKIHAICRNVLDYCSALNPLLFRAAADDSPASEDVIIDRFRLPTLANRRPPGSDAAVS